MDNLEARNEELSEIAWSLRDQSIKYPEFHDALSALSRAAVSLIANEPKIDIVARLHLDAFNFWVIAAMMYVKPNGVPISAKIRKVAKLLQVFEIPKGRDPAGKSEK